MAEENKTNETEVIKAVREEFEKKLAEQEEKHKQDLKDMETKHIAQIRALMSGNNSEEEQEQLAPELSFEEQTLNDTRKKFGLKGEK